MDIKTLGYIIACTFMAVVTLFGLVVIIVFLTVGFHCKCCKKKKQNQSSSSNQQSSSSGSSSSSSNQQTSSSKSSSASSESRYADGFASTSRRQDNKAKPDAKKNSKEAASNDDDLVFLVAGILTAAVTLVGLFALIDFLQKDFHCKCCERKEPNQTNNESSAGSTSESRCADGFAFTSNR